MILIVLLWRMCIPRCWSWHYFLLLSLILGGCDFEGCV